MTTLEKIRAEICEERSKHNMSCSDCLDIIDKYAEQECDNDCNTCKYGDWKRNGLDITMADDKCGGCCSWKDKYEPIECEDAKSTREVMKILTMLMDEAGKDGKLILSDAKEMIMDLPSVQPKAKVGHWQKRSEIVHKSYGITTTRLEGTCSECGERQTEEVYGNACDFDLGKFCKNCGARMLDE